MAAMTSYENSLFIRVVHRLCSFAFHYKTQPTILVICSAYQCWFLRFGTTEAKKIQHWEGRREDSTTFCRKMGAARDVPNLCHMYCMFLAFKIENSSC